MGTTRTVAVIVGSLRKESFNRKLAKALIALAPESLRCEIVEIRDLPLYDEDLDASPPAAWTAFRDRIRPVDAVLFVTPEYNRSMPGAMKNAIDVGSRPYGKSVWEGKPAAIASASPGPTGGFGANHHLRQAVVFLNVPTMQMPEAYVGNVHKMLDESGTLTDERTKTLLGRFMQAFAAWVERFRG
jgi:chromate reductase, NAD(P)H dehydrogenase (quinone)